MYTDDLAVFALRDAAGQRSRVLDLRHRHAGALHDSVDAQRAAFLRPDDGGGDRVSPHRRQRLPAAAAVHPGDRPGNRREAESGLGAPGGYYVDSSQTMEYNGLQTSLRKRFSNRYSWEVNYTLGKSESTQGGDLSAYYIAVVREQPGLLGSRIRPRPVQQRRPASSQRLVHLRAPASAASGVTNGVLGGWQILRHRPEAFGQCAAASRSLRASPQPARRRARRGSDHRRLAGHLHRGRMQLSEHRRVCAGAGTSPARTRRPPGNLHARHGARPLELERAHDAREELRSRWRSGVCRSAWSRSTC